MPKRCRGSIAAGNCQFWLMKSEPNVFSIQDLEKMKRSPWDGVRNYAARNNMMSMNIGDQVLFYHSNAKPSGVVGTATVCRLAYEDLTATDPSSKYFDAKATGPRGNPWRMVDVKFDSAFAKVVTLETLKREKSLNGMTLFRQSRLSVQPVTKEEFQRIVDMGNS